MNEDRGAKRSGLRISRGFGGGAPIVKWVAGIVALVVMMPRMVWADAEPRQTESGLPERWAQPGVVVVLDPSLADLGPGAADAIKQGMETWVADVPGIPSVVFENATEPRGVKYDGKSVISAGPITIA